LILRVTQIRLNYAEELVVLSARIQDIMVELLDMNLLSWMKRLDH